MIFLTLRINSERCRKSVAMGANIVNWFMFRLVIEDGEYVGWYYAGEVE